MTPLEVAFQALVTSMENMHSNGGLDVFIPLYANTFVIASAAKTAIQATKDELKQSSIKIHHFPWEWDTSWSREPDREPPFFSDKKYQIFFATKKEFERIHRAGISFFAIPVSIFHPRFLFISPNNSSGINSSGITSALDLSLILERLERSLAGSVNTLPCAICGSYISCDSNASNGDVSFLWITDIPDQAESISAKINDIFSQKKPELKYWNQREIEESLGVRGTDAKGQPKYKAYLWGGPMASAARQDVRHKPVNTCTTTETRVPFPGWPRLRSIKAECAALALPDLTTFLTEEQIKKNYTLYCCIGYKEGSELTKYYSRNFLGEDKEPWSLDGKKFSYLSESRKEISCLVKAIRTFYKELFCATTPFRERLLENSTKIPDSIEFGKGITILIDKFMSDYDEHSRVLDPIAQLYQWEQFAQCLCFHHDYAAFNKFHP